MSTPEDGKIEKALKRIKEAKDVRIGIRNGKVSIIYKQEIVGPLVDDMVTTISILSDITE